METGEIMKWVENILIFSIPASNYMCWQMYKDLKKKDKIIELQNKIIAENNGRNDK